MKKRLIVFLIILIFLMGQSISLATDKTIADERLLPRLVDDANLLSSSQYNALLEKLDSISEAQKLDVVIVTVDSLEGSSAMDYADDFFDYKGYGMGDNHDGILLLISMEARDWWLSTSGYGIEAFTDAGISYMMDEVLPYLGDGDFYQGFDKFANLSDEFITIAKTDKAIDSGNIPKKPLGLKGLVFSLIGGIIVALIVTGFMRSQLRTVRMQVAATNYVTPNSLRLGSSRDIFLYNRVTKVARPKDPPKSSSGSSTHRSSSGRSHGGSGGKF